MIIVTMLVCFLPPAKLKCVQDVLCVSGLDLQRLTGLSRSDVQQLITAAATACRPHPPVPGKTRAPLHNTRIRD